MFSDKTVCETACSEDQSSRTAQTLTLWSYSKVVTVEEPGMEVQMRMKYSHMYFHFKIKTLWDVIPCRQTDRQTDVSEELNATTLMVEILYPEDLDSKVPEISFWQLS